MVEKRTIGERQMRKTYYALLLALAFTVGTIIAAIPVPVKAQGVRFYVWTGTTNIFPSKAVGTTFYADIWIETDLPVNDPAGIVGYALSVRVDPTALEVMTAAKTAGGGGLLETFLMDYGYDLEGYTTALLVGPIDKVTGTILDVSEYIMGYKTLGVGAGAANMKLMRFAFKSRSTTIKSPIDIFGRNVLDIQAIYTTPDGIDHFVDVMDDGYYIGVPEPEQMYVDLISTLDVAAPQGSKWLELWDTYGTSYTLTTWKDVDASGTLTATDIIALTNDEGGEVTGWTVNWLNPSPISGDGKSDMTLLFTPDVPEFPLGLGVIMAIAPAIPILYLWRTRKKKGE